MLKFLSPVFLYFLPLAAAPLLIHLLARKRAVPFPFPSIMLLKKGALAKTINASVLNIILLIIRTAAILALVLMFAGPSVVFLKNGGGKKPAAVFIDYSYSMNQTVLGGTMWEEGIDMASEIVSSLPGRDVGIFTFADKLNFEGRGPKAIENLRKKPPPKDISHTGADEIAGAVSAGNAGRIFIISDFCLNAINGSMPPPGDEDIVCFRMKAPVKNFFIKGYESLEDAVSVRFSCIPPPEEDYSLSVYSGLTRVGSVRRGAGANGAVLPLKREISSGRFELKNRDSLPEDNVYFFARPLRKSADVSCLKGISAAGGSADFFLRKIFEGFPLFNLDVLSQKSEFYGSLSGRPAAILTDISGFSREEADSLRKWAAAGGILFIFPGKAAGAGNYNRLLADMLPAYIYPEKDSALTGAEFTPAPWMGDDINSSHFDGLSIRRYFPLRPREDAQTVLASGREAVCAVRRFGSGAVFLFSVPADMSFSNLPVQSGFPPFLMRTLRYFVFERKEVRHNYFIGERAKMPFDSGTLFLGKDKIALTENDTENGRELVSEPLTKTGIYRATSYGGKKFDIAVNLKRGAENNLTRMTDRQIKKIFPGAAIITPDDPSGDIPSIISGHRLSGALLVFIFILLIAEVAAASFA